MTNSTLSSFPLVEALEQAERSPLFQKAWDAFFKRGLPGPKHEAFKYFKLGGLYQKNWAQVSLDLDSEWIEKEKEALGAKNIIVTYNGHYLKEHSSFPDFEDQLIVLPFSEALISYASFFQRYYDSQVLTEQDPFALLSLATAKEGLFIYVPKKTSIEEELTLLELSSSTKPSTQTSMTLISLGQQAELQLSVLSKSSSQNQLLSLSFIGYQLDQGAQLRQNTLCLNSSSYRFDSLRVDQMRESSFYWVGGVLAPEKTRQSLQVNLKQEGARADLSGLLALKEKEQAHVHALINHLAPHTESSQLFKHLLQHEALSSFEGKIFVDPIAQKTNAYQLNQNCLLSSQAQAYSKPNLEIFADDVKASHGSTTGQIDQEELFYLLSRGLSKSLSRQILLKGFCDEILDKAHEGVSKQALQKELKVYLGSLS